MGTYGGILGTYSGFTFIIHKTTTFGLLGYIYAMERYPQDAGLQVQTS